MASKPEEAQNSATNKTTAPPAKTQKTTKTMDTQQGAATANGHASPPNGLAQMERKGSKAGSQRSIALSGSICSASQVFMVTEAQSVLPSLTSAYSIDSCGLTSHNDDTQYYSEELPRKEYEFTSSVKDFPVTNALDVYDDPGYTDTITSTDSTCTILRRSMSVPPQYTYKPSRRLAKEVFEDFIAKDDARGGSSGESDDEMEPQDSLPDLPNIPPPPPKEKKWKKTMPDLLENPEYTDSIQSTSSGRALLAKTAISISRDGKRADTHIMPGGPADMRIYEPKKYTKDLYILSVSFMFVFASYLSLRNLQSSIIFDSGLALYALASVYLFLLIGCMFATTVVQRLRPKRTILISMVAFLFYIAANFYPTYYTLIPAACFVGFSLAILWTAHATYLTSIAITYAEITQKNVQHVLSRFNGIFFMFFGVSQILGGLLSSAVLYQTSTRTIQLPAHFHPVNKTGNATSNSTSGAPTSLASTTVDSVLTFHLDVTTASFLSNTTIYNTNYTPPLTALSVPVLCGSDYCHSNAGPNIFTVEPSVLYTLLGLYAFLTVLGIGVTFLFLDRLEGTLKRSHASLFDQLTAVFRWFFDKRVLLLLPLMFYTLVEMSFMFGEFFKAYVTCAVGIHIVGYAMLCLSACSSLSSYLAGKLQQYCGRPFLVVSASIVNMVCLVVMLVIQPSFSSLPVILILTSLWGLADGVWFTQIISFLGFLFMNNREPAFAGLKMCQALGAALNFITAHFMCTSTKIYILMGLLLVSLTGYIVLEVKLHYDQKPKTVDKQNEPSGV